jgi:hypothetical protein
LSYRSVHDQKYDETKEDENASTALTEISENPEYPGGNRAFSPREVVENLKFQTRSMKIN